MSEAVSGAIVRRPAMAQAQKIAADSATEGRQSTASIGRASRAVRTYAVLVASIVGLVGLGGAIISVASAVTYQGPTQAAPAGNIPMTIWNALSTGGKQANATIDVDGMLSLGAQTLDLGVDAGGQNLMYGFVPYGTMHVGDGLLLLETESSGVWTPRMRVDRDGSIVASGDVAAKTGQLGSDELVVGAAQNLLYGNMDTTSAGNLLLLQTESADRFRVDVNGNAKASGSMTADGCFGATFVGITSGGGSPYTGSLNGTQAGYTGANALCSASFAGSHMCTVEEMLESIRCSTPTSPVQNNNGKFAWLNGGPPGFTADANDCKGWTSDAASSYGRFWAFDSDGGGYGTMTSCNAPGLDIACCR